MEEHRDVDNSGIIPHLLPKYKQKISSYKVIFYDMEDNEIVATPEEIKRKSTR